MDIDKLLQQAVELGASDLHLSGDNPPILRIDGEIRPLDAPAATGAEIGAMLTSLLAGPQRSQYEADLELDLAIEHTGARFRVNAFTNRAGPAAVFRVIPQEVPTLKALGAPPAVERVTAMQKGLVLITGPTGSGKSTTLAAMIDHINTTSARHILTIEDPIEFTHRSQRSLINQREIGRDSHSFARALRSALREDPDVILVGELRDLETIGLALTAAETGHLVLSTLHTTSAAKTVDRLIDVFPSADKAMVRTMLSGSLRAVVAQTLLRRKVGAGRVAAFEILVGTPAVANLVRENQISQINAMMQTGARYGMQLMTDAIQQLVGMGLIDAAEAARGSAAWTGEGQSGRSSLALDLASAAGVGPDHWAGPRGASAAAPEPDYAF